MRKLKLFHDFDRLSPAELQRVHDSLSNSTYHKTMDFLREEFGIVITYGRLQRYYQRWQETQLLKAQTGLAIGVNEYIQIQNGEALPFSAIALHLIQKAACIQAAAPNPAISKLLALQRIANNGFNQEMARAKAELEKRKQACRELEIAHRTERDTPKLSLAQPFQPVLDSAVSNIVPADFQPVQTLSFPFPGENNLPRGLQPNAAAGAFM